MSAQMKNLPKPGLRERKKNEKERRIRQAARTLFLEHGFETTTLRDVAALADVGFGTVSSYSSDKTGLLAMVFVEELKDLPQLFGDLRETDSMDQLIEGLAKLYRFWAETPSLSYAVLRELEFYTHNPHFAAILERRNDAQRELESWIAQHQEKGIFAHRISSEQAAATLFAVYTSAVREWVGNPPLDLAQGLARLRFLLALPMQALRER